MKRRIVLKQITAIFGGYVDSGGCTSNLQCNFYMERDARTHFRVLRISGKLLRAHRQVVGVERYVGETKRTIGVGGSDTRVTADRIGDFHRFARDYSARRILDDAFDRTRIAYLRVRNAY